MKGNMTLSRKKNHKTSIMSHSTCFS